ncbi:MAG: dTDP-4-dehydrorhamnose 3,5-epimerase [Anaerolineales bacterium]
MRVIPTRIPEVKIIEPRVFSDERGFFLESYNQRVFAAEGLTDVYVQDNHSRSVRGTVRGLHYQVNPGQVKLVRVVTGVVWDVAVDIRYGSPTYGQWVGVELSAENKRQLYVPVGFAHGYCVVSDTADFLYKVTSFYSPPDERGLLWNDPDLAIAWPVDEPLLSRRDQQNPRLSDIVPEFTYSPNAGS